MKTFLLKILGYVTRFVPRDKLMHGAVGLAIVPAAFLVYWVATHFGIAWGIDLAGVLLAGGKEAQDKLLRNGTPEWWDAIATGGACIVFSHVCDLLNVFATLSGK